MFSFTHVHSSRNFGGFYELALYLSYLKLFSAFDQSMYVSVSTMVGDPLIDRSWKKVSLPIFYGGLGIRLASLHTAAAYICSWSQSSTVIFNVLGSAQFQAVYLDSACGYLAKVVIGLIRPP